MNAVGSVDRKLDSWGREQRLHGIKMQINKDCAFQVHLLATRANKESGLSVRVERSRESLQAEKTKKAYRQGKNNPRWWGGSLSKGKTQQSAGRRHFRPNISMQTTAITPSASRRRLFMIVKDPWHNWMILSWYSDLAELIPFSFFFEYISLKLCSRASGIDCCPGENRNIYSQTVSKDRRDMMSHCL